MLPGRFAIERLRKLRMWRRVAEIVGEAARRVLGDDVVAVYVIGGAAEGRLTVLSDVDVLIVLRRDIGSREATCISMLVYEEAVRLGMPWDYPLNLHLAGPKLLQLYRRFGGEDG